MIIGVTGSIGSGKSSATSIIAKKTGYVVADADKIAKKILQTIAKKSVINEFGTINRKKLAEIVFNDKKKLAKLNGIIHPLVDKEIKKIQKKEKNIIVDAPLLIEYGKMKVDCLIILKRDKSVAEKDEKRRKNQFTFEEKLKNAKKIAKKIYIIDNSGSLTELKKSVEKTIELMN